SLQPLPEDDLVHGDMRQEPVVADSVEAALDVALQDPGRAVVFPQDLMTMIQGVGTAPLPAKTVGVGIGRRLLNRIETEQVQGLHGPSGQGRDTQRTPFRRVAAFRNVDPSPRLWLVTVAPELVESRGFRLRRVPEVAVHAGGGATVIGGHS